MPRFPKAWEGILVACLVLLAPAAAQALDELPDYQPFRSIVADSTFTQRLDDDPGTDPTSLVHRIDATFRLAPGSDGIRQGDDLHISNAVAFPTTGTTSPALGEVALRFSVAGECFQRRGGRLVFRLAPGNRECVELGIEPFSDPFTTLLRRLDVKLTPRGQTGKWKLSSVAVLTDPGFPLPVAGFADPKARLSGVTVIVGDDGMFSRPVAVGFRTLAP